MPLHKADQVNVVSDKVKLTKKQADAIEKLLSMTYYKKDIIVDHHAKDDKRWDDEIESLNGLPLDTLIRALYIGYEVEQTVEEQLLEYYEKANRNKLNTDINEQLWSGARMGMEKALNIIGMKVKGINE